MPHNALRIGKYSANEEHYYKQGPAPEVVSQTECGSLRDNAKVLELGFHTGRNLKHIVSTRPDVTVYGLDIQRDLVERVQDECKNLPNAKPRFGNFVSGRPIRPLNQQRFDLIFTGDGVCCHLDTPSLKRAVDGLQKNHLNDDGKIILSIDNPRPRKKAHLVSTPERAQPALGQATHDPLELESECLALSDIKRYRPNEKRVGIYASEDTYWCTYTKK